MELMEALEDFYYKLKPDDSKEFADYKYMLIKTRNHGREEDTKYSPQWWLDGYNNSVRLEEASKAYHQSIEGHKPNER